MAEISLYKIFKKKLQVLVNLTIFLPYYFNVETHLCHLLSPWKRLVGVRKEKGFVLEDLLNRLSMNLVSCGIGLLMRLVVIIVFVVSFALFLLLFTPVWLFLTILTTPLSYLFGQIWPPAARKNKARQAFIKKPLLEPENAEAVAAWFERVWAQKLQKADIFSLNNLTNIAPLGRDWHYGFTPTLDDFSHDLTSPLTYKSMLLDREDEVRAIERALLKSENANILLVGAEGVGKHTILDGLAQRLAQGKTMPLLQNQRIVQLNMERILAEKPTYEEKVALLEELLTEASLAKNIIIVVNDFHKYVSGNLVGDFSSVWEKFARRPLIRLLGITTPFYYEQLIFHHEKLPSLFDKIVVEEPSKQKALLILLEKAIIFERHYRTIITYEAVLRVIERCQYYITHIPFPEKAIGLLDDVCTRNEPLIKPELVDAVLQQKTKLPVGKLGSHLKHKLLNLEGILAKEIYGQNQVLSEIGKAIRRSYLEERRKKPLVSLLFLGPTGVGKTETAKQLAQVFFQRPENLLRFDMSFYQNKENLDDLIGSYRRQTSGQLADAIREHPYSVLLIDEIEKAHKDILNVFLTLLDEGYLVDGFGERVDGKNLILIATSNAASKEVLSWVKQGKSQAALETLVRDYVIDNGIFSPEFLNRFDKTLVFAPLEIKTAYEIGYKVAHMVIEEYLEQKKIKLSVSPSQLREWVESVYKMENGAREIGRVIREKLADLAAEKLLA